MAAVPPPPVCIQQAETRYHVPAELIRSVLKIEAGGPNVVHRNRNGTDDLGWMQINSSWLPELARYGIRRHDLLTEPCVNVAVGAWILQKYCIRFNGDWTRAIRAYNAGPANDLGGHAYARKVILKWHDFYRQSIQAARFHSHPSTDVSVNVKPTVIVAENTQEKP